MSKILFAISHIMPEELKDRIRETGEKYSDSCWEAGFETLEAIQILEHTRAAIRAGKHRLPPEIAASLLSLGAEEEEAENKTNKRVRMQVYLWMSRESGRTRWSSRSIRRYSTVAEFYGEARWKKYRILPFAHFEYAMKFQDEADRLLDLCIRYMDNHGGKWPSFNYISQNIKNTADLEAAEAEEDLNDYVITAGSESGSSFFDREGIRKFYRMMVTKAKKLFDSGDVRLQHIEESVEEIEMILFGLEDDREPEYYNSEIVRRNIRILRSRLPLSVSDPLRRADMYRLLEDLEKVFD